ncbi:MAG: hypothetical protein A2268_12950 [Candidatus Raymondbacteria bacterium RifOxyA12_full_50_37]|uniref:Cell division protein FtsX n=1 Tax=Candidatus Raymondbacteria bacterium RIFOXYD12_FULL_49_13 TaxID=1817890 RepID=A0A1F7EZR8_UNCRA|nr:MAG: hypothetical protein A2268_12950 [Candidatus Raymondbacteria bacterium RifOxyA12_full_50_37]OGJ92974.1 MAG: hypothetical protein A2248_18085 [Candidatus Raymondbacteria bacterium RIFOXYA2_FULL_49_16]OGJ97656.1 MAG: hypothetical protein A2487_13075 [Candidatus Raymondbacteria bacterium RifOxyC12_full_50_8]OGJ99888.1 MAG: hypothetical protein A2519_00065 [Candidatus Raymondbacteria bacterium RIFOXYD12_FULL_49_13]OGP40770.1 MAG: hypothetical protein A2324_03655 [Candidatus Raymondbacteria 
MISKTLFLFREALRGFFQSKMLSFIVIMNIALSLFFVGLFFAVFFNLNRLIQSAEDKIQLEVFLEDGAADIHVLKNEIMSTEGVADAEYVSKKDAYRIFKEEIGEEILTAVEGNPLPASFKIKILQPFRTPEKVEAIRESLRRIPFVDEVSSVKDWVPKLERTRNIFVSVSLGAICIIGFAIYFMVSSTVRITLLVRRDLIEIMELLGATPNFIRIPFILEGMLKGLFGGLLSFVFLALVMHFLHRFFPEAALYKQVFAVQVFMGLFLGLVASVQNLRVSDKL